jgi:hypothetical protein
MEHRLQALLVVYERNGHGLHPLELVRELAHHRFEARGAHAGLGLGLLFVAHAHEHDPFLNGALAALTLAFLGRKLYPDAEILVYFPTLSWDDGSI